MFKAADLQLYLVSDQTWLGEDSLEQVIEEALSGGVTFLQYREKHLCQAEKLAQAAGLKRLAQKFQIPFVINDDFELALTVDADGVHLGQDDLEASEARKLLGKDKILGISVGTVEEALRAQAAGADYIGVGAMFATNTKMDAVPVRRETLTDICAAVEIPVVAIGGIQKENLLKLKGTGVDGIAVVSAILAQADKAEAAKNLKKLSSNLQPMKTVLTIAGSDCSGGAGIQADLKTMMAHGVYGMSVITALTAQNTTGVYGVEETAPSFVGQQIDCIFNDIFPDAVKIGMVSSIEIIEVIAEKLTAYNAKNIVIDPVMFSTSGHALMSEDAMETLVAKLLPLGCIVTPNLSEAERLWGQSITTKEDMASAGKAIGLQLSGSVLVKGGHLDSRADDLLVSADSLHWYEGERIHNPNTHGTGCTLSSAIACNLALGLPLETAVFEAKAYITTALKDQLNLGKGRGPLNHCVRAVSL